jgi:UDP-glucose 4-epimerase
LIVNKCGDRLKVLVTGTSGRIGSAIAKRFISDSEVIGVDIIPGKFTTHVGDITDRRFLDDVMHDIYAVVHCAAYHAPHVGVVDDSKFRNVNVTGTENLLNKALATNVKRFVYTSTTSVYGCSTRFKNEAVWVTEQLEPNPEDIYDETKLEAEELCYNASKAGMDTIVLRISRCFPEPDNLMVFYRLYRGVSREDVAEAHFQAVQSGLNGFHVFNISAPSPFVKEECKFLLNDPWSIIDIRFPKARGQFLNAGWQLPDSIDRVYVIEKAINLLRYQPRGNFENILLEKTR